MNEKISGTSHFFCYNIKKKERVGKWKSFVMFLDRFHPEDLEDPLESVHYQKKPAIIPVFIVSWDVPIK